MSNGKKLAWALLRVQSFSCSALLCAAFLIVLNGYVARDLFSAEFIAQPGSIESSFISLEHYLFQNWSDSSWFPLWYGGMPLHNVYQPLMHYVVVGLLRTLHVSPQHAYHLVSGLIYSLAPVTLFLFCLQVTRKLGYAFVAALFYSSISTAALLSRSVWAEIGGPFHSRRFFTMVANGETTHILATAILPVTLLFIRRATVEQRAWYFPLASLSVAAILLTNWPGPIGLALGMLAFCLSEIGEKRTLWVRLLGVCVTAYLISAWWIPPTTLHLVFHDAQQSDYSYFRLSQAVYAVSLIVCLVGVQAAFRRMGVDPLLRFGLYFCLFAGTVTLSRLWYGWNFLPQAHRFQIELEMAIAITSCWAVHLLLRSWPRVRYCVGVALSVLLTGVILFAGREFAERLSKPMDMTRSSEYRIAQAFKRFRPNDRVFAPGSVSLWMNLWTDTPQISGCCDQGIPNYEHRISDYTIYSGQNTGNRDADYSVTWLRAYGATAVAIAGPASTSLYKIVHPFKFEGRLPVLWREGDDIIYDLPQRSRSLAHVIPRSSVITDAPIHGLQVEQLERYVAALDDPQLPLATFRWASRHAATISTNVDPGQIVSVQISYDAGWLASVNAHRVTVSQDKLGQLLIDPACSGACSIQLEFDGGTEQRAMIFLGILGVISLVIVPVYLQGNFRLPFFSNLGRV